MSGINLEKRAEQVGIQLAKRNITKAPTVRVGLALDVSGSTRGMFQSGVIQETTDRLLAVALKFDDNGELDMWSFDNSVNQLKQANASHYNTYVKKNIIDNNNISKWGGTSYAPCMESITDFYFEATPVQQAVAKSTGFLKGLFGSKSEPVAAASASSAEELPAMVLFVTDGVADDEKAAERVLKEAQKHNVYWQLIGVGPSSYFKFLKKMADDLPNVGFVNLESLEMSDEKLYEEIISEEFCEWVGKIK